MTVRLVEPRDPRKVPSYPLWTMRRGDKTREARMRILPIGDGHLEFGVYDLRADGSLDLIWSQVVRGPEAFDFVRDQQREYEKQGWVRDLSALQNFRVHG